MKTRFSILFLFAMLSLPLLGFGQQGNAAGERGTVSIGLGSKSGSTTYGPIPYSTLLQVLNLAAPYYNMLPEAFVRAYNTCGCITVTQIGHNTYYVVYGGIGIQIVIDDARYGHIGRQR